MRRAADAAPGPLSALVAAIVTFAARALRNRRLAWAMIAEPVDAEIDRVRHQLPQGAGGRDSKARIHAAIDGGHLPEQDAGLAAPALVGALLEGLIGPLAPGSRTARGPRGGSDADADRAARLGVVDARARGLVVQTALPAEL